MAFTSLGEVTLGTVVPIALTATAAATAQLPQLQAKLAALLALQARVAITPPNIAASIQLLVGLTAGLEAALTLGAPAVTVDISAMATVMAEISALIGAISLILGIEAQLGGASVHLLRYDGTVSGLAPSGIPGLDGSANVNAILIVAASSVSWSAMQAVFKTA